MGQVKQLELYGHDLEADSLCTFGALAFFNRVETVDFETPQRREISVTVKPAANRAKYSDARCDALMPPASSLRILCTNSGFSA